MDIAIALRTIIFPTQSRYGTMYSYKDINRRQEWVAHLQAGAGIVADSNPEDLRAVPVQRDVMRAVGDKESEICEEGDQVYLRIDREAQKERIRKIVSHQKSLYPSYSADSCTASSCSLTPSSGAAGGGSSKSRSRSSLLELMKVGGMSLGRLFDMEHTSLSAHLTHYSGSPTTRPVFLWGTDSSCDNIEQLACWSPVKSFTSRSIHSHSHSGRLGTGGGVGADVGIPAKEQSCCSLKKKKKKKKKKTRSMPGLLTRKRSYRALPARFRIGRRWKGLSFRRLLFRLRRLKIVICGEILY
ncbi:uncharacterized protein A4U43_C07F280 [Asparagus officinalis]|uniref:Uncharacterized protein n=1 Tax=Asparagus officinalis TaxID=4686 RepID=A0A5P1E8C7_ASPOF|nr:uncharacterized protein A4U43_C07F280 [Asparagus officinalis]